MARVGRNDPCPCGSGRKYKKCCQAADQARAATGLAPEPSKSSLKQPSKSSLKQPSKSSPKRPSKSSPKRPSKSSPKRPPKSSPERSSHPNVENGYLLMRVQLQVARPDIWRTFLIRDDSTFEDLHQAIQDFGWDDCHLWSFTQDGKEIAGPAAPGPRSTLFAAEPTPDASRIAIVEHLSEAGDSCTYIYDFGDSWIHEIALGDRIQIPGKEFDRALLDGAGSFPPEDCGGAPGWERLVAYRETGTDPWGDPESLEMYVEAAGPVMFELEYARARFGAVLTGFRDLDPMADPERPDPRGVPMDPAVTEIDKDMVKQMIDDAKAGLAVWEHTAKMNVEVRSARFCGNNARIELEVAVVRPDGVVMDRRAEAFLERGREFGLLPDDLGADFVHGDHRYRVVGLRPRAKNPVVCQKVGESRDVLLEFPASLVRQILGRNDGHSIEAGAESDD